MPRWFFQRKTDRKEQTQPPVPLETQEEGRLSREDVPYALPKDLEESQRLNLQHYLFRYMLKGNYAAPLSPTVSTILDVGSGTGIWGQEMAQAFPAAHIFGLDLEPPQTGSLATPAIAVPDNYHFVQGNVLKGLPFPDHTFEYIHQRMLVLGLPLQSWPEVIRELARVVRPGGWIELLELGTDIHPTGPATSQLFTWTGRFFQTRGIDPTRMKDLGQMLSQQGLHSVQSRPLAIPLGAWDRRLGILLEKDLVAAFRAVKPAVSQNEGIPQEDFEQVLLTAIEEWKRNKATYSFYLAYGQA